MGKLCFWVALIIEHCRESQHLLISISWHSPHVHSRLESAQPGSAANVSGDEAEGVETGAESALVAELADVPEAAVSELPGQVRLGQAHAQGVAVSDADVAVNSQSTAGVEEDDDDGWEEDCKGAHVGVVG